MTWCVGERFRHPRHAFLHPETLRELDLVPFEQIRLDVRQSGSCESHLLVFTALESIEASRQGVMIPEWYSGWCQNAANTCRRALASKPNQNPQCKVKKMNLHCFKLPYTMNPASAILLSESGLGRAEDALCNEKTVAHLRSSTRGDLVGVGGVFALRSLDCFLVCSVADLETFSSPFSINCELVTVVSNTTINVAYKSPVDVIFRPHADPSQKDRSFEVVYNEQLEGLLVFFKSKFSLLDTAEDRHNNVRDKFLRTVPPARHALIYGPQGVGKSHLLRVLQRKMESLKEELCPPKKFSVRLYAGVEILSMAASLDFSSAKPPNEQLCNHILKELDISSAISILLIDDIECIIQKTPHAGSPRSIAQAALKKLLHFSNLSVIGATRNLDCLKPKWIGQEQFEIFFRIPVPTLDQRIILLRSILKQSDEGLTENSRKELAKAIAFHTPGMVALDLITAWQRACLKAHLRIRDDIEVGSLPSLEHRVKLEEFLDACKQQKQVMTDRLSHSSPATMLSLAKSEFEWVRLAGYANVKNRLKSIAKSWLEEVKSKISSSSPSRVTGLKVKAFRGILLHGPTGCGKTAFAHSLGAHSGMNILTCSGAHLFSVFVRGLFHHLLHQLCSSRF